MSMRRVVVRLNAVPQPAIIGAATFYNLPPKPDIGVNATEVVVALLRTKLSTLSVNDARWKRKRDTALSAIQNNTRCILTRHWSLHGLMSGPGRISVAGLLYAL